MSAPSAFVERVIGLLMVSLFADLESRTALPRVALYRTSSREWTFDSNSAEPRPMLEGVEESIPWVGVVDRDVFAVESDTIPQLLVELAVRIQRHVMDATGRDWPEARGVHGFEGLAVPAIGASGDVGWSILGADPVPFGSLATRVSTYQS